MNPRLRAQGNEDVDDKAKESNGKTKGLTSKGKAKAKKKAKATEKGTPPKAAAKGQAKAQSKQSAAGGKRSQEGGWLAQRSKTRTVPAFNALIGKVLDSQTAFKNDYAHLAIKATDFVELAAAWALATNVSTRFSVINLRPQPASWQRDRVGKTSSWPATGRSGA